MLDEISYKLFVPSSHSEPKPTHAPAANCQFPSVLNYLITLTNRPIVLLIYSKSVVFVHVL